MSISNNYNKEQIFLQNRIIANSASSTSSASDTGSASTNGCGSSFGVTISGSVSGSFGTTNSSIENASETNNYKLNRFTAEELGNAVEDEKFLNNFFITTNVNGKNIYSLKQEFKYLQDLDKETIMSILTMTDTYIYHSERDNRVALKDVVKMGYDIAKMAEAKGAEPTQYVATRLVDFVEMKEIYPNIKLEDMNKELATNQINNNILKSVFTTYENFFEGEAEDIESLVALAETSLILGDEEPSIKTAYIDLQTVIYSNMAKTGDLSFGEYYEYIKEDLIKTFPGYAEFSDEQKELLKNFVNTLSPEQIKEYQDLVLNLPSCENENYQKSLTAFLDKLFGVNNYEYNDDGSFTIPKTTNSEFKLKSNNNSKLTVEMLYNERLGVDFDADKVINDAQIATNMSALSNYVIQYQAINEIFTNASSEEEQSQALWQAIYLIAGTTDDKEMTKALQAITGNTNLSFVDGALTIENGVAKARSLTRAADEESDGIIKSAMKSVMDYVVERGKSYINFADYDEVDFNDLSSVANYIEKTLDGIGNLAVDSSLATGPYGMWAGAAIHGLTAVAGLVSDLSNPEISTEQALAEFGSKLAQAGIEAVLGKYGEAIGQFVGKYASKMFAPIANGIKSILNKVVSLAENITSIEQTTLSNAWVQTVLCTNQWAGYLKYNSDYFTNKGKTLINNSLKSAIYGKITKSDVQGVLFRKLKDTSAPEYYSISSALKGIKAAVKEGSIGSIKLTSNRYERNYTNIVSIKEFMKQLNDVKNLRNFLTKQSKTNTPVTVLRGEILNPNNHPNYVPTLFKNLNINGMSIDRIRQAHPNMSDLEFMELIAELVHRYGATTFSESFVGTSLNAKVFMNYLKTYNIRYKIACPQGTQGAFLENLFARGINGYNDTQAAEFLLQAGTKFNITDAWVSDTGALCFAAEVMEKTVDAAGNEIWKKVAAVVIPLALSAISSNANAQETPETGIPETETPETEIPETETPESEIPDEDHNPTDEDPNENGWGWDWGDDGNTREGDDGKNDNKNRGDKGNNTDYGNDGNKHGNDGNRVNNNGNDGNSNNNVNNGNNRNNGSSTGYNDNSNSGFNDWMQGWIEYLGSDDGKGNPSGTHPSGQVIPEDQLKDYNIPIVGPSGSVDMDAMTSMPSGIGTGSTIPNIEYKGKSIEDAQKSLENWKTAIYNEMMAVLNQIPKEIIKIIEIDGKRYYIKYENPEYSEYFNECQAKADILKGMSIPTPKEGDTKIELKFNLPPHCWSCSIDLNKKDTKK